jgi:uncharacterized protein YjbI with pentapeptide repeats
MSNPEHLQILGKGVAQWNRWREEASTLAPDLSGAHLPAADLAGFDLRRCNLTGAVLRRADLGSVLLTGADLTGADLTYSYLGRADLYRRMMAGVAANTDPETLLLIESADLAEATIAEANLAGAFLRGANLSYANLRKAHLESAFLFAADLRAAQLQEANLDGADLSAANLTGANLSDADLGAVNFWGAVLKGADFTNARFRFTLLAYVELGDVKGLDSVRHEGPSTIGVDTLVRSGGQIPESFLRACGLSDEFIEQNQSLIARSERLCSCFISYTHTDSSFAHRLHDQLQVRGIRCWLDEKNLKPGDRILDRINDAIGVYDKIILCCSRESLNSWWVKDEVRKAHERERKLGFDIIVPVNLDGYLLKGWEDGLAADVRSRVAADFTDWKHDNKKFEEQFERVLRTLRTEKEPSK